MKLKTLALIALLASPIAFADNDTSSKIAEVKAKQSKSNEKFDARIQKLLRKDDYKVALEALKVKQTAQRKALSEAFKQERQTLKLQYGQTSVAAKGGE